jgi:hypothetical protein
MITWPIADVYSLLSLIWTVLVLKKRTVICHSLIKSGSSKSFPTLHLDLLNFVSTQYIWSWS